MESVTDNSKLIKLVPELILHKNIWLNFVLTCIICGGENKSWNFKSDRIT